MTLTAVKEALDRIDERSCCEGTHRLHERLAIMLPDGDVGAVDDASFVDWLLEHSELAPFGEGSTTKVDPNVRRAQRLKARGEVDVVGFDPAGVLGEIEAALSPRMHLAATLTDVIIYSKDGKFARHKDTPRTPGLVGTLVVGLPIAHDGGAFHVEDGKGTQVFDWSGPPDPTTVRWVALFSDVDHEVKPVTSGTRVTLVYSLVQTDRPRADPSWDARRARLRGALERMSSQTRWPVMIACTRHVITDDRSQPQGIETLRGTDRDIADVLAELGLEVAVRSCISACPSSDSPGRFPDTAAIYSLVRLKEPLAVKDIASHDVVTFSDDPSDDEGEDLAAYSLAPYILDDIQLDQWVIRDNAAATMTHEVLFSDTGYFGNESYMAYLYTLAALEVSPSSKPVRKPRR